MSVQKIEDSHFNSLYRSLKEVIDSSRQYATSQVNQALILAYWNIGKIIKLNVLENKKASYGDETINKLAETLTADYGEGFSKSSLTRMIKFYSLISDLQIVATLSQKLSWSHFVDLIKIEDEIKREFYISICANERWSVRTLRERINSMLYERTAISKKPDSTIRNDLAALNEQKQMSTDLFLRNPYIFDFLGLKDSFSEKDLENTILLELEKFLLEFGNDFAFLSRQKRIQIGGNDYYIDLLFYHRKLKRLVVIELKVGDFIPEYKGQVELYLKWLSKHEKLVDEQEPIAIILCSGKEQEIVELMDLEKDNIHISEYWLKLPSKEILQQKLHNAIENAKSKIEAKEMKELD
jgi:predicted nuclease of restriction endonuclease-like (RecB) superfamily